MTLLRRMWNGWLMDLHAPAWEIEDWQGEFVPCQRCGLRWPCPTFARASDG